MISTGDIQSRGTPPLKKRVGLTETTADWAVVVYTNRGKALRLEKYLLRRSSRATDSLISQVIESYRRHWYKVWTVSTSSGLA